MDPRHLSVTRTIGAPARRVFALLADPRKHPLIDGSGTAFALRPGSPSRLGPGVRFSTTAKLGIPYRVTNTVVEFEEGRRIAWARPTRDRWRWELEPLGEDATTVTQTLDWSASPFAFLVQRLGLPERNRPGMEASLERLEQLLGAEARATSPPTAS